MTALSEANFKRLYASHLKHLKLKGLQPKTIEAYARAIRRIGGYFDHQLGLRRGEGLRLAVGDLDGNRQRVPIRDAKGNQDRLVPLPETTLDLLRRFWQVHRNPWLRFPI